MVDHLRFQPLLTAMCMKFYCSCLWPWFSGKAQLLEYVGWGGQMEVLHLIGYRKSSFTLGEDFLVGLL